MDMPYTDAFGLAAINAGLPGLFGAERSDPIVIGLEGPLTGDQRSTGRDMWRGAKLAVEELNREGGILGRRVKLVRANDRADPERALPVAKWLNRLDADAVIGPYNSGVGMINLPYYVKKEIVPVHLTSIDDTSGLGVTVQPKNSQIAPKEEAYILSQGAKRVSMLVDPSAYTVGMADRLEASLRAKGVQVERFSIVPGSSDYSSVIEQALAVDPDLVYVSTYYPEGSSIARGLEASDTAAQRFLGLANVDPAFVTLAGLEAARASVFSGVPEAAQLPFADAYVQAYEGRFDRIPGVWGTFTYDSVKVLADAMEVAGSTAFKPALDSLLQTRNYEGATGEISIDPLTGNRVNVPVFILNVDANGVFVPISTPPAYQRDAERLSLSLDGSVSPEVRSAPRLDSTSCRLSKDKIGKFTIYSHQDDWESEYIDAHEPGYGVGDQFIVSFPLYKTLAGLRAGRSPVGTAFSESVLFSSGTVVPDKDIWVVNSYDVFKDGRIDSTSLYSNTRGGSTPAGVKDRFTVTGGIGRYFGARGTIVVKRMGEDGMRYLKSAYKLVR